ncbi:Antirestriction protein [anaerobic digester metagenome]
MRKIFNVYLARAATPYSEAYADLDLPATPYELLDALDKLRLSEGESPYLQINEYFDFEGLAPLLSGNASLYELNALAQKLSELDERQRISFKGLVQMEVDKKQRLIQVPRLIDLAYSTDCCHVVDVLDNSQLGRFHAENGFIPEAEQLPDTIFELLDFEKIGRETRIGEGGVFTDRGYVVQHTDLKEVSSSLDLMPHQPDYQILLELTGERHNFLELPDEPQAFDGMENCSFHCLECRIPQLMGAIEASGSVKEINDFAQRLSAMTDNELLRYKAALIVTECADLKSAAALLDNLDHFMLDTTVSSPEDAAISELNAIFNSSDAEHLQQYLNLPAYGRDLLERDNAVLTPYGRMDRDDYQPMMAPFQEQGGMEIL